MIQRKAIREAYPVVLFSFIVMGVAHGKNAFTPDSARIENHSIRSSTRSDECGIKNDLRVRTCMASLSVAAAGARKN